MITSRRFPQFSAGSRPSRGLEVHLSSLRECAARYEGYTLSLFFIYLPLEGLEGLEPLVSKGFSLGET